MIEVAAAIIQKEGKILICRRGEGGSCAYLWEFPGGKRETGETLEACAIRECREELDLEIRITGRVGEAVHKYPDREVSLTFFLAECTGGSLHNFVHEQVNWVRPGELTNYDFCPADEEMIRRLSKCRDLQR